MDAADQPAAAGSCQDHELRADETHRLAPERSQGVDGEFGSIEPLQDLLAAGAVCAELGRAATQVIGSIPVHSAEGVVPAAADAERETALPGEDGIQLPAVQECAGDSVQIHSGYVEDIRKFKIVWNIKP